MKQLRLWMEYTGRSEIEVEVDDDFEVPNSISDWPIEWLQELDDSLNETSPSDWGSEEL